MPSKRIQQKMDDSTSEKLVKKYGTKHAIDERFKKLCQKIEREKESIANTKRRLEMRTIEKEGLRKLYNDIETGKIASKRSKKKKKNPDSYAAKKKKKENKALLREKKDTFNANFAWAIETTKKYREDIEKLALRKTLNKSDAIAQAEQEHEGVEI